MFDLVAEVAAHERHQRAGVEIGRAQHLSQVPLGVCLGFVFLGRELLGAVGEVPAEDHHVGPVVADQVGYRVGAEGVLPGPSGQGREDEVVLAHLLAHLLADDPQVLEYFALRLLALAVSGGLQAVCGDAPFEQRAEQQVVDRVADHPALPALVAGEPHDAVADVVVQPDDVGVLVVDEVV